jgi:hypothetical protein
MNYTLHIDGQSPNASSSSVIVIHVTDQFLLGELFQMIHLGLYSTNLIQQI